MSTLPQATSIRTAQLEDAVSVTTLLAELGYPDNEVDGVRRRLAMWSSDEHCTALVAERSGRVVGIVAVAAIPYLEREGRWGRIVALVVTEDCRGEGIGHRLVEAAEEVARDHGCVTMEISSARHRSDAHTFYRDLGYEDRCAQIGGFGKDLVPAVPVNAHVPVRR